MENVVAQLVGALLGCVGLLLAPILGVAGGVAVDAQIKAAPPRTDTASYALAHLSVKGRSPMTGYDRDPARAAMLAADGVSAADGLAGLAGSDIVLVLVATPAQMGRVIGEIAMWPDTGMPAYVVVSSSVAPADMQAAARAQAGDAALLGLLSQPLHRKPQTTREFEDVAQSHAHGRRA